MTLKDKHTLGTPGAESRADGGVERHAVAREAASPGGLVGQMPARLLDVHAAAHYLGVSPWTLRELEAAGVVPRVHVPMPPEKQSRPRNGKHNAGSGEVRRLLFDRQDLDECVERWKDKYA